MRKLILLTLLSAIFTSGMADDVYNVPFVDDFDTNTKREQYTTIDANGDGITIKKHYQTSILPGFYPDVDYHEMEYASGFATQDADDWFITPKIHLEEGKVYSFSFDVAASFDGFAHRVEVCLGDDDKAEAMTTTIIGMTNVASSDRKQLSNEFSVSATGDYRFGIHVTSEPDHASLYFTNIAIKNSSSTNVPVQVDDLSIVADPTGALKATVNFTTPTKNVDGTDTEDITKVEVSRGDKVIGTITSLEPGQKVSWTDNGPQNGFNDYMVVAYNSNGRGMRTEMKGVYVGVDIPLPPTVFTLTDETDHILLEWGDAPETGENGMVVRPDEVSYYVEELNSSYSGIGLIAETRNHSAQYACNTLSGTQDLKRFGIRSINSAGWSEYAYARMVTGAPYNLPYSESFATGKTHGLIWQEGSGTFYLTTDLSADNDAGCASFTPNYDGEGVSFNLGKINLRQALHPVMSFWYKGNATIKVRTTDMSNNREEYITLDGTDEWTMTTIDLSRVAGQTYIIPKLFVEGKKGQTVFIDDIQLKEIYENDLSVTIDGVEYNANDDAIDISFTLQNEGLTDAENVSVCSQVVGLEPVTTEIKHLEAGTKENVTTSISLREYSESIVLVKVEVLYNRDLYLDNNMAYLTVEVDRKPAEAGDADGIANVDSKVTEDNMSIYSLDGRCLGNDIRSLAHGIYIIGGKKYVKR